jgi:drug/metabolite transporter (DMT)-like permease
VTGQLNIPPQVLALLAFFCGILSGVFLKGVAPEISGEAIALRTFIAFAILAIAVMLWPQPSGNRMGRIGFMRAVLDAIGGLSFALAIFNLPLSLLASILATLPIVSVALSALILSEPLSRRTMYALTLAFAGTLLILKPGLSFSTLGVMLALISTLSYALRDIATRRLHPDVDPRNVILLSLAFVTVAALSLVPLPSWDMPSSKDAVLIALGGVTALGSTFLIVHALRQATINQIAPLRYTSVFWALIFDAAIWGFVPGPIAWCGIVMILAAGVLQHTKHRQGKALK